MNLLKYQDIPEWMKDNEHILTGYRPETNSYKGCLMSLFYLNNESGNVYSHLLGAMLFSFLLILTELHLHKNNADYLDYIVVNIGIVSAISCFVFSSMFHLFSNHSKKVCINWGLMDYVGIILLIIGSTYPAFYYGFYCYPVFRIVYLIIITTVCCLALFVLLNPKSSTPEYRKFRTNIYVGLGLSNIIPGIHCFIVHGIVEMYNLSGGWFLLMAVFYIFGAYLYANRIPEKTSPGKFDYFAHSHQLFHIFVVLAAISHYIGVIKIFGLKHALQKKCL